MASAAFQPDPRAQSVAEALKQIEISTLDIWDELDVLSTHTRIEAIEVPLEGIVIGVDNHFSAVMNLYVSLQYGSDNDEGFTTSDSFLAKVEGRLENGDPVIDSSEVDTSAFYE